MNLKNPALIVIDVQKGFDSPRWGQRNNPDAEKNIKALIDTWRKEKAPIYFIQNDSVEMHSPLRPSNEGNQLKDLITPLKGEPVLHKSANSAFIGTSLNKDLRAQGTSQLILVGLTTDHCVSTTARMAANLGYEVYVVNDATATFSRKFQGHNYTAETMHELALASLNEEFATIVDTWELL